LYVPPYSDDDDTTCEPVSAMLRIANVAAACPDPTASAPGSPTAVVQPPSNELRRASSTACVGFMMRV
jgi:hypothetical protein